MSARRQLAAIVVALLTTLTVVAGCGGDDDGETAGATTDESGASIAPSAAATEDLGPAIPTNTELQQPRAESTIQPRATLSAVPGTSELPAPGLRTIQGFPVPPGVKVKDPGPLDDTWQFDIRADDLERLVKFYERVLPQLGFTVRTGVTYTLGNEKVYWDLVFDGRISGSMVRDPGNGVLFVVVNPPGQPAIAGED